MNCTSQIDKVYNFLQLVCINVCEYCPKVEQEKDVKDFSNNWVNLKIMF